MFEYCGNLNNLCFMFDYWVVSLFNDVLEIEDIGMFDLIGQHVLLIENGICSC